MEVYPAEEEGLEQILVVRLVLVTRFDLLVGPVEVFVRRGMLVYFAAIDNFEGVVQLLPQPLPRVPN